MKTKQHLYISSLFIILFILNINIYSQTAPPSQGFTTVYSKNIKPYISGGYVNLFDADHIKINDTTFRNWVGSNYTFTAYSDTTYKSSVQTYTDSINTNFNFKQLKYSINIQKLTNPANTNLLRLVVYTDTTVVSDTIKVEIGTATFENLGVEINKNYNSNKHILILRYNQPTAQPLFAMTKLRPFMIIAKRPTYFKIFIDGLGGSDFTVYGKTIEIIR